MQPMFPFLERVRTGVSVKSGLGPGLRLVWAGTSPEDVEVGAVLWVTLSGQKAMALFAVGPKARIAARAGTLQRLFASFAPDRPAGSTAARAGAGGKPMAPAGKSSGKVDNSAVAKGWRQRLSGMRLTIMSNYYSLNGRRVFVTDP